MDYEEKKNNGEQTLAAHIAQAKALPKHGIHC